MLPAGYGYYICAAGVTNYTISGDSWTPADINAGWSSIGHQTSGTSPNVCSLTTYGNANVSLVGIGVANAMPPTITTAMQVSLTYALVYNVIAPGSFVVLAGADGEPSGMRGNVTGVKLPSGCSVQITKTSSADIPYAFIAVCPSQSPGTYNVLFNATIPPSYGTFAAYVFSNLTPFSLPAPTASPNSVTQGSSSSLIDSGAAGGVRPYFYQWYESYNGGAFNAISGAASPGYTFSTNSTTPVGTYGFILHARDSARNSTNSIAVNVIVNSSAHACGYSFGCVTSQPPASECPASCPVGASQVQGCTAGYYSYECVSSTTTSTTTTTTTTTTTSTSSSTTSSTTTTIRYDTNSASNGGSSITVSSASGDTSAFCVGASGEGISSVNWNQYGSATGFTSVGNTTGNACSLTSTGALYGQSVGILGTPSPLPAGTTSVVSSPCTSSTCTLMFTQPINNYALLLISGSWSAGGSGYTITGAPSNCASQFQQYSSLTSGVASIWVCSPQSSAVHGTITLSMPTAQGSTESASMTTVLIP